MGIGWTGKVECCLKKIWQIAWEQNEVAFDKVKICLVFCDDVNGWVWNLELFFAIKHSNKR